MTRHPLLLLRVSCVVLVAGLLVIQGVLVRNTYALARANYRHEVREAAARLQAQPWLRAGEQRSLRQLRAGVMRYAAGQWNRPQLVDYLRTTLARANQDYQAPLRAWQRAEPDLWGLRYGQQVEELVLLVNGQADTLLARRQPPLVLLGAAIPPARALPLGQGQQAGTLADSTRRPSAAPAGTLRLAYATYADLADAERAVGQRLRGLLGLAAGLLLALVGLFYAVFRTLSRQKQLADAKTDLANHITHELQTPLSSVGVILKSLRTPAARQQAALREELLATLERQYTKLHGIVDSIVSSAVSTSAAELLEPVELTQWLAQVVADSPASPRLALTQPAGPLWVRTDPQRLLRLLDNLLDNACKYSPAPAPVQVRLLTVPGHYVLQVQDQGPGIAPAEQARIFEKFYRVPAAHGPAAKGLGLGLYLARQYAYQLGGQLGVQSGPAGGSTFTLTLPRP